jgi:hypothetical protein
MGTPETWTDQTMVDVVRSIRDSTGAQVALVEAKPALAGTPWLEMAPPSVAPAASGTSGGAAGAAGAGASPAGAPAGTPGGTGAANGIAPIAGTPAAASTEAASSPSTVATNGSDTKDGKTEVK